MTDPKNFLAGMKETVGPDLLNKIQNSKILLVGAGGIGCELLKNLALTGFRTIHVIDLDTIDVSNLNRQLLFRSQHVGMPKCTVAAQVAAELAPGKVEYIAHHGNVCDNSLFHVQFVKEFDLVLNALDNVDARRRVNRLCLAAAVPLIEAGTTGYLGQVKIIHKPETACYECQTQEPPKVYPICTIRSTPSMPVHTIVWAKELFKLLFGAQVQASMLYEDPEGEEPSTYMETVLRWRECLAGNDAADKNNYSEQLASLTKELITQLCVTEIQKQLDMDRYKTARKKPVVLSQEVIAKGLTDTAPPTNVPTTTVWSPAECVAEWAACCATPNMPDEFDKDHDASMRFVTAAANLRSFIFGIEPLQSLYAAKGIAGNIIPAIATTNAICAGLQILQAFNILRSQLANSKNGNDVALTENCAYINCCRNKTRNGLYVTAAKLDGPNPSCFVCKSAVVPLSLNLTEWTLQEFLDKIVKNDLGFEEPTVLLDGGTVIWEEGADADSASFEPNLPKRLQALPCGGFQHGTVVTIEDFSQDLTVELSVTHQTVWEKAEDEGDEDTTQEFVIGGTKPVAKAAPVAAATNGDSAKKDEDDDDLIEIVDGPGDGTASKRPAEGGNDEAPPAKKAKTINGDKEIIEIE